MNITIQRRELVPKYSTTGNSVFLSNQSAAMLPFSIQIENFLADILLNWLSF